MRMNTFWVGLLVASLLISGMPVSAAQAERRQKIAWQEAAWQDSVKGEKLPPNATGTVPVSPTSAAVTTQSSFATAETPTISAVVSTTPAITDPPTSTDATTPIESQVPAQSQSPAVSAEPAAGVESLGLLYADGSEGAYHIVLSASKNRKVTLSVYAKGQEVLDGQVTMHVKENDVEKTAETVEEQESDGKKYTLSVKATAKKATELLTVQMCRLDGSVVGERKFLCLNPIKQSASLKYAGDSMSTKTLLDTWQKQSATLIPDLEAGAIQNAVTVSLQKGKGTVSVSGKKILVVQSGKRTSYGVRVTQKETKQTAAWTVSVGKIKAPQVRLSKKQGGKVLVFHYKNMKHVGKVWIQMYSGRQKKFNTVNQLLGIKPANTKGGSFNNKARVQKITYRFRIVYQDRRVKTKVIKFTK